MSCLNYKICNNYNNYLEVCKSTYEHPFEMEDWEEFFQADLKINSTTEEYDETIENYKGKLKYSPNEEEYPVLVVYSFDNGHDRFGSMEMQIWDWISLKELK